MNALTIITSALKSCKVVDPEEIVSGPMAESNRLRLNLMLDAWSIKRLMVHVRTSDTHVLTIGDGDYTIGLGAAPVADIAVVRPVKIEQAYLRDSSGNDYPLDCIAMTQAEYNASPLKTVTGVPSKLFYNPTAPNGTIYFDVLPDKAYTLYLFSWKPFTAFADLDTEYDFPPGYESAITANFKLDVAEDYDAQITQRMVDVARETKTAIQNLNAETPWIKSCGSSPGINRTFNPLVGY